MPESASAQSDPSFGRTILECPPPRTVVGDFLAEIRSAEALHDSRYTGSDTPNRYSTLERRVIKILKGLQQGPCGPRLLGALLDEEGAPPAPGFTRGRELAYSEAVEIAEEFGYIFTDEDEPSSALDREAGVGRANRVARWKAHEIAGIKALLGALGPAGKNLPVHTFIKDDVFRYRTRDGVSVKESHDTLASYWTGEIRMFRLSEESSMGCYLHTVLHELVHAYLDTPANKRLVSKLAKDIGWRPNGNKKYNELYIDCQGRGSTYDEANEFWATKWKAPTHYGNDKYHESDPEEDVAERIAFTGLGPVLPHISDADCLEELDAERPNVDRRVAKLLKNKLAGLMPLFTPPEYEDIHLSRSTRTDLEEKMGAANMRRSHDDFETYYWMPEGSSQYDFAAVFRDGRVVAVGTNVRDQGLTRRAAIKKFGPPTNTGDNNTLHWDNRLLAITFDDTGKAVTAHYGFQVVALDP